MTKVTMDEMIRHLADNNKLYDGINEQTMIEEYINIAKKEDWEERLTSWLLSSTFMVVETEGLEYHDDDFTWSENDIIVLPQGDKFKEIMKKIKPELLDDIKEGTWEYSIDWDVKTLDNHEYGRNTGGYMYLEFGQAGAKELRKFMKDFDDIVYEDSAFLISQ